MIITVNKAILHIIAPGIETSMYSQECIDIGEASVLSYIINHIEKVFEDPSIRTGEFSDNSGFKYHITEYKSGQSDFVELSKAIAERLQEGISQSETALPSDIIVADCIIHERPVLAVLKCDNKTGFTHRVVQGEGTVKNEIINHYAILPPATQKLSECAFIFLDDMTVRFKGKLVTLDGERLNLISDVLLECDFDISVKESFTRVEKTAKAISEEYGADTVAADAKLKQFIREAPVEDEALSVTEIADAVFETAPAAKAEFTKKLKEAEVPELIEKTEYVAKRASKNIKIVTDTGIEISFPAEYYKDEENVSIINNDDGTISIRINNVGEILNKS